MSVVPSSALIAARVNPSVKAAFGALAMRRGLSESALLTLMIRTVFTDNDDPESAHSADSTMTTGDRISVRLRSGDLNRLRHRATTRGMRPARYLTTLVHAHLRADPPLPASELAALKQAVSELTALRRRLADSSDNGVVPELAPLSFADLAASIESLRRCVADLVRANLISWESDDA